LVVLQDNRKRLAFIPRLLQALGSAAGGAWAPVPPGGIPPVLL